MVGVDVRVRGCMLLVAKWTVRACVCVCVWQCACVRVWLETWLWLWQLLLLLLAGEHANDVCLPILGLLSAVIKSTFAALLFFLSLP